MILAEKFGASRASLREALSALEILKITERQVFKGIFIRRNLNYTDFIFEQRFKKLKLEAEPIEIIEARKLIETQVAMLASERATEEDPAFIQITLNKMDDKSALIPKIMEIDREFHIKLAFSTHNSILYSVMNHIIDLMDETFGEA